MDKIFEHMKTRFILMWAIISFVIIMFILPLLFTEIPKDVQLNIALIISIYAIPMFWIGFKFKRYNISFKTYLSKPSSFSFKKNFCISNYDYDFRVRYVSANRNGILINTQEHFARGCKRNS
ncbi:hypothetical protein [Bacillus wiedmannii]|uniref:hypothetical protein n=1 Tax=Bacillus wiedmannii TaxID=1890302 RepID=UPI00211E22E4|nr:hypothetical protein [Bacillus wiedmannii]